MPANHPAPQATAARRNIPPSEHKSARGKKGEDQAAAALEQAGMKVIARNFRSVRGEIDIIAEAGETIIFVEVKTWSVYGLNDLSYSINPEKQRRIIETAKYFLSENRKYNGKAVRFDVILIGREGLTHLESAFMERV